jgi:hypothetical protein
MLDEHGPGSFHSRGDGHPIEIQLDDGLWSVQRIDLFGLEASHGESPGLWGGCIPIIKQLFSVSTDP